MTLSGTDRLETLWCYKAISLFKFLSGTLMFTKQHLHSAIG